MAYERVYQDPYPNQWADYPATSSPLNKNVFQAMAEAITHIEDYLVKEFSPIIDLANPLHFVAQRNYETGESIYIAKRAIRVLAVNINLRHESVSSSIKIDIQTTGTIISSSANKRETYSLPYLCGGIALYIIDLTAGDTISFTNNSINNSSQVHLVYETTQLAYAKNDYFQTWRDNEYSSNRVTVPLSSKYSLVLGYQDSNGNPNVGATMTNTSITGDFVLSGYSKGTIGLLTDQSETVVTTSNITSYIGNLVAGYSAVLIDDLKQLAVVVSVSGGYNGGATIKITCKGKLIFTAVANDTYNMAYDKIHDTEIVDNVTIDVTITPPATTTSELGITISTEFDMQTLSVMPDGSNTSWGYSYLNTILINGENM